MDFETRHVEIFHRTAAQTFSVRLTNEELVRGFGNGPVVLSCVEGGFSVISYLTPEQAVELSKALSSAALAARESEQAGADLRVVE